MTTGMGIPRHVPRPVLRAQAPAAIMAPTPRGRSPCSARAEHLLGRRSRMAELAVDQPHLLKTMRWWDGFVIGLANPGFLLVGLAGSVVTVGLKWPAIIWFSPAVVGALQAYVYAEPAAMFPDKSGGLSMYAKEGWRKHFSLAGPIATFGYWFAWSSVLAIYGGIIGTLMIARFWPSSAGDVPHVAFVDVTWPRAIGAVCILACFTFNVRGMRPAVWFSYATGAMMIIPLAALA